ncbi:MAG TPA: formyltetrahydrofolate deformylase [Spirochaetota bacterium]|nr:formyltetrahydrofolate deformylase [Spirochaetota bacterium]
MDKAAKNELYILKIKCPDQKGLIYKITSVLYENQFNIVENDEFVDPDCHVFFMRTCFQGFIKNKKKLIKTLEANIPDNSEIQLLPRSKKKIIIFATRETHCLGDLLLRCSSGEMEAEIAAVIANHKNLQYLTEKFNVPFHYIPVNDLTRPEHEKKVLNTLNIYAFDYIVLAKYMRILSSLIIDRFPGRIINIHHSFLPAFSGARPYKQAFNRGVKIIGATAHFATVELDSGPIIQQNVISVNHSHSAADMARAGKNIEKITLAQALELVFKQRVFVHRNKTVIFS